MSSSSSKLLFHRLISFSRWIHPSFVELLCKSIMSRDSLRVHVCFVFAENSSTNSRLIRLHPKASNVYCVLKLPMMFECAVIVRRYSVLNVLKYSCLKWISSPLMNEFVRFALIRLGLIEV